MSESLNTGSFRSLPRSHPRLHKIDVLRGLALIGMAIYHFSWDLAYFGYIDGNIPESGALYILARTVAASFLFLAGFSLFLAQGYGFHKRAFFRRLIILIICAALISAVSWLFMRQDFIYFGILHEIALASCLGLLFLRAPLLINCLIIVICLIMSHLGINCASPALLWLGLSQNPAPSFDYVPLFPWFSCVLAGLTMARFLARKSWLTALENSFYPALLNRFLQFIGRRSLLFYLVHQPLLIGLVFLFSHIAPPSYDFAKPQLKRDCRQTCILDNSEQDCRNFCACVIDGLGQDKLLRDYLSGKTDLNYPPIASLRAACEAKSFPASLRAD